MFVGGFAAPLLTADRSLNIRRDFDGVGVQLTASTRPRRGERMHHAGRACALHELQMHVASLYSLGAMYGREAARALAQAEADEIAAAESVDP